MKWPEQIEVIDTVIKQIRLSRAEHDHIFNCLQGLRHTILSLEAQNKDNDKAGVTKEKTFNVGINGNIETGL
jgi:hypothetical protein